MEPPEGKVEITGLYLAGVVFQTGNYRIPGTEFSGTTGLLRRIGIEKGGKPTFHDLFYPLSPRR
jgi:hypothetical protein